MSYVTNSFDERVVELLKSGCVGFMPADTIYGLSCRALDEQAVAKIYELKKRDQTKPLIVLISSLEQLTQLDIHEKQVEAAKKYWPGPLTLKIFNPASPAWLHKGTNTVALRWPANKDLKGLIDQVGPLVSTSANLQGYEHSQTMQEAKLVFGEQLDFYVDAGERQGQPSTIVEVVDGKLKLIRQGEVKVEV